MRQLTASLLGCLMMAGGTAATAAEPATMTQAQLDELLNRLDAAESRIQVLQTELDNTKPTGRATVPSIVPPPPSEPRGYATPLPGMSAGVDAGMKPGDRPRTTYQVMFQNEPGNTPGDRELADQALRIPGEGIGQAETRDIPDQTDFEDRLTALEDLFEGEKGESLAEAFDAIDKHFGELEDIDDEFENALKDRVKRGTSGATMKLFGRLHLDYWSYPSTDDGAAILEGGAGNPYSPQDRFIWRRARFGAAGDIRDNMFYKFELEFADPNDFEVRDVYMGFRDLPYLQSLVIGNQKRPYGLDHLNSSRYNVFIERPFIIEAGNEDARRFGIQALGVSDDLRYNWRYGVFNLERQQADEGYTGDSYQAQIAGRFASTYWWDERSNGRGYGHWAVAGTVADPNDSGPTYSNEARFRTRPEARSQRRWINTGRIAGVDTFGLVAAEHVINVGAFQLVSEAQYIHVNRSQRDGIQYEDTDFWGAYVYASYFLTGEHIPWNRESGTLGRVKPFENFFWVRDCDGCFGNGWGAWQVAARYSYADFNSEDIFGGLGSALTIGLNWHWNPQARLQFNWIKGSINDTGAEGGGGGVVVDTDYDILGVRMMVDF